MTRTTRCASWLPAALLAATLAPAQEPPAADQNDPCAERLRKLHASLEAYLTNFGDNRRHPPHSGARFWICLSGKCGEPWKHPDVFFSMAHLRSLNEVFKCPAAATPAGRIDYTGPRRRPDSGPRSPLTNRMPDDLPIACDRRGNHPDGGHVLTFDGTVRFLRGEAYDAALRKTQFLPDLRVTVEPAAARPSVRDDDRIDALVAGLGNAAFARRREAQARLAARGVAAVPALERALAGAPEPEVRSRLEMVLAAIAIPRIVLARDADGTVRVDGRPATAGAARAILDRVADRIELRLHPPPARRMAPGTANRVVIEIGAGITPEQTKAIAEACEKEEPGFRGEREKD